MKEDDAKFDYHLLKRIASPLKTSHKIHLLSLIFRANEFVLFVVDRGASLGKIVAFPGVTLGTFLSLF